MRISDWSSDVCSSDLNGGCARAGSRHDRRSRDLSGPGAHPGAGDDPHSRPEDRCHRGDDHGCPALHVRPARRADGARGPGGHRDRMKSSRAAASAAVSLSILVALVAAVSVGPEARATSLPGQIGSWAEAGTPDGAAGPVSDPAPEPPSGYAGPDAAICLRGAFRAAEKEGLPGDVLAAVGLTRSEEHTSELQSLMRISYAFFCLK